MLKNLMIKAIKIKKEVDLLPEVPLPLPPVHLHPHPHPVLLDRVPVLAPDLTTGAQNVAEPGRGQGNRGVGYIRSKGQYRFPRG